jgi:predicted secreted protein
MSISKGYGTTIAIGVTAIGKISAIAQPKKTADSIEVSVLDSPNGYKEYIGGMKDGGEISLKGFFDTSDAGQLALDVAFEAESLSTYTITLPAALGSATYVFDALITAFEPGEANLDSAIEFSLTLKVIGKPILGTSASTGMSAVTISGTAGAMVPTFAIAKFAYSWIFTTDTSITVTPTAASHTIKLYVDGVYTETITSGGTSAAITGFGTQTPKKLDVVVYEAGKTPKTYTFAAIRTT